MNLALCTLFEGDYHLGVAALLNSLHHAGFAGPVVCGHRGPRPAWAGQAGRLAPLELRWVELEVAVHLAHHKPDFMRACLARHAPAADTVAYLDPDIVVKAPWAVFERWLRAGGVALCEDLNASLPGGHPYRLAWEDFLARHGRRPVRPLERYYNSGFVGVARADEILLRQWAEIVTLAAAETGPAPAIKRGGPDALFHTLDQDALNIALLLETTPIHAVGPEGMDFLPGGHLLSHAAGGHKPWRGGFLRAALRGRPPGTAHKQFHLHAAAPLPVFSRFGLAWRRGELATAALLGRFYRRT